MLPVSRAAVLIGCPSHGSNRLPGVYRDLENMRAFLRSPRSGCFENNEIHTLEHATFDAVQSTLMGIKADYCRIYFSGHGYTDGISMQRMLCLEDHKVPDSLLTTASKTQLLLVDACRNHIPAISGIPEYIEPYDSFVGSLARLHFDNCIRNAKAGKQIVYGTKDNTVSLDSLNGGVFTHSLLTVASTIPIKRAEFSSVFLKELLPHVEKHIKGTMREMQVPDVVFQTDGYNMPFIINALQIVAAPPPLENTGEARQPEMSPVGKLLTASLLAFGLYALFKEKS